jgi:rhodanese-related sulfurtransferase
MNSLQVTELAAFVDRHAPVQLLDVREPWEVERAAIRLPGATLLQIPMQELPARLQELEAARPVVCICHHGARSAQVVAYLAHLGYPDVYNLAGGVDAWSTRVDTAVPRY